MKKNVGSTDKIIRIVLGVALGALFFTKIVTGGLGIALLIAGGVLLATAFMNFCPIFAVFGTSSCAVNPKESSK